MSLFLLIVAALFLVATAWLILTMPPAPHRSRWAERHFDSQGRPRVGINSGREVGPSGRSDTRRNP